MLTSTLNAYNNSLVSCMTAYQTTSRHILSCPVLLAVDMYVFLSQRICFPIIVHRLDGSTPYSPLKLPRDISYPTSC